jgi:prepilin peptidase CpaA
MSYILSHWPLLFVSVAMIIAAAVDGWKLKVPNWLTFPIIFSGWALGLFHDFGWLGDATGVGGFGASLAATFLGMFLLLPLYAIGGVGGGDVKMQMGFGAWVGSFYGLSQVPDMHPGAMWIIVYAFALAAVIGGVLALVMIWIRGDYAKNLANTRAILADLVNSKGVSDVAEKAAKRKPTLHLLPYGIPLCLGFLSYLAYLHWGHVG